ncbi:putative drug exporter of the RND superfamily [Kytococcus aerolatus]|uniref:Putative drug exporter of the RND superfamily n=1 Tax=Kytococcus aerolatus TaxID=592308 RepID=A0A212U5G1_9MICO|nr:MMPL family transporter [Kytococcus aerolatus]SNC73436.1 putative drug exporter of the RND superfamily [Kytococcus aerolatus]
MAEKLYSLGHWASRHVWPVILAWVLVLAGVGGAAAAFSKPFSSEFTLPGTEFQQVTDQLKGEIPKAAGGSGVVVFRTESGKPFTTAQKKEIASTIEDFAASEGVTDSQDPFAAQRRLDAGPRQIAERRAEVADGEEKLAEGKKQLAAGEKKLAEGEEQLAAGEKKLADGEKQVKAGEKKLAEGEEQLAAGEKKLADGEKQVKAGEKRLAEGEEQLAAGERELEAGQAQAAQGREELAAQKAALAEKTSQVDALEERLGADAPQVREGRAQLAAGQDRLEAAEEQLRSAEAEVEAGEKELAEKSAELEKGKEQLAEKSAELEAGKKELAQRSAELEAGKQELAEKSAELEAGKKELAQRSAELEKGKKELVQNEKKLAENEKKLAAAPAQLDEAEARLALTDGMRLVSEEGDTAYTSIRFEDELQSVPMETRAAVMEKADGLADEGVEVTFSNEMSQDTSSILGPGEIIGLVVAGIVLLVMLRSVLAAGLPLLNAVVGVAVGIAGAAAMTHFVTMQDITPALAVMLGLAVGIDYTLFIVHRHRQQMVQGMDQHESIGLATGTAGNAVGVAGVTVIIALAALTLTGIPFLGVMGLVAAATVLVAVLVAWTLAPALMSLLGERVLSRGQRAQRAAALAPRRHAGATRFDWEAEAAREHHPADASWWTRLVTRLPWLTVLLVVLGLGTMAWPITDLRLGMPDGATAPADSQGYQTYDTIRSEFGAGANGPLVAMVEAPAGMTEAEATDLQIAVGQEFRADEQVEYVVPIGTSEDRSMLAFQLTPSTAPGDEETIDLVHRLRDDVAPALESEHDVEVGYTGHTVANIDISEALGSSLPLYLGVVVGLSLVLLVLVFRSIPVPLVATVGFLLSVGAAFGAVVAVYQWGWLGSLFAVNEPGAILSFLPTLVIGVLFGLAMDYQMFLVSGMREAWAHGSSARRAVHEGFRAGAAVVTAAALIMVSVFAGFVHAELTMIRPVGLALALGVLVDAFVVRMTLTPAVLHLLGERAWWIPRWLDRILPDLDVEGARLQRAHGVDPEGHGEVA